MEALSGTHLSEPPGGSPHAPAHPGLGQRLRHELEGDREAPQRWRREQGQRFVALQPWEPWSGLWLMMTSLGDREGCIPQPRVWKLCPQTQVVLQCWDRQEPRAHRRPELLQFPYPRWPPTARPDPH